VKKVWFARGSELVFMAFFGKSVGFFDAVKFCVGVVLFYRCEYLFERNGRSPAAFGW